MPTKNLSEVKEILEVNQYHLPEAIRKKIHSQSPRAQQTEKIEAMRLAFVERYGDEFGEAVR